MLLLKTEEDALSACSCAHMGDLEEAPCSECEIADGRLSLSLSFVSNFDLQTNQIFFFKKKRKFTQL